MKNHRISAALVMVILAAAAISVPALAKQDGGGRNSGDSPVLYLSGTPREMGMQYGQYARDAIATNVDLVWEWAASEGLDRDSLVVEAVAAQQHMTTDMIEELEGMSETSGVPYEDLLVLNVFNDNGNKQHACTNFAAAGAGTFDGQALSSKNRDLNNMQVLLIVEPLDGYRYIGMMSAGALGISQGINEKGLAIGHNWMPVPEYDETGFSPFMVNEMVMAGCAEVGEAIALIDEVPKREGATFVISDASVSAFVESVPTMYAAVYGNDVAVDLIEDRAAVHTNHYVLEPFFTAVCEDGFGYMWTPSYARYDRGMELIAENGGVVDIDLVMSFTRDLENYGNADPNAIIEAHPEVPDDAWVNGWPGFSICNARTVSASVFTTDAEYPEHLSVMWMSINNPAWSPYVPLHNALLLEPDAASEGLEDYIDGHAWSLASKLRSSGLYEWGDLVPTYEDWEADRQLETKANEDYARDLIDRDKVGKAAAFLTEADCGIASEALDLMASLLVATVDVETAVRVEA